MYLAISIGIIKIKDVTIETPIAFRLTKILCVLNSFAFIIFIKLFIYLNLTKHESYNFIIEICYERWRRQKQN